LTKKLSETTDIMQPKKMCGYNAISSLLNFNLL